MTRDAKGLGRPATVAGRLAARIEHARWPVLTLDGHRIRAVNPVFRRMLGWAPSTVENASIELITAARARDRVRTALTGLLDRQRPIRVLVPTVDGQGGQASWLWSGLPRLRETHPGDAWIVLRPLDDDETDGASPRRRSRPHPSHRSTSSVVPGTLKRPTSNAFSPSAPS